jgi:hypothetical protein
MENDRYSGGVLVFVIGKIFDSGGVMIFVIGKIFDSGGVMV